MRDGILVWLKSEFVLYFPSLPLGFEFDTRYHSLQMPRL